MEIANIDEEELETIQREVKIHSMVRSSHAVHLYQTIKTGSNIYMFQEYANGYDLECLHNVRGFISQAEARLIMK